jgi:hypothetical protein
MDKCPNSRWRIAPLYVCENIAGTQPEGCGYSLPRANVRGGGPINPSKPMFIPFLCNRSLCKTS